MAATSADCSKEQEENHALPYTIPLYNDTGDHAHPALTTHYPTNLSSDTRYAALLCCRGGGHATCLGSGEGTAEWAADNGMVGVEVEYRTSLADGGSGFEVDREPAFFPANGFQDLRRAIAVVRAVLHNVWWTLTASVSLVSAPAGTWPRSWRPGQACLLRATPATMQMLQKMRMRGDRQHPPCRHPPCRGLCFATRLSAWRRGRGPTRRGRPSTSWGNLES